MHVKRAYVLLVPIPPPLRSLSTSKMAGEVHFACKNTLLWQAAEIFLKSLECRFLVRHGSNMSFETGAPL